LKKYVDPAYPSPLTQYIGVFGKWSTFIPIVTGAGALFITLLTSKHFKKPEIKGAVAMYGFTSLLTGTMNGLIDMGYLGGARYTPARAATYAPRMQSAPVVVRQAGNGMSYTPTGISGKIIRA
jgi:hypothetical protein